MEYKVFKMALKTYIGARYTPKYVGEWNQQTEYGPLSVVSVNEDANYVSKKVVPAGTEITNEEFWLKVASWNAQVEQYTQNVNSYRHSVEEYKLAIEAFYADTIHAYDNKAAMIADTSLKDGETVITCGGDTIGDGMGSFYQVVSAADDTTIQLTNELYAKPFSFDIYAVDKSIDKLLPDKLKVNTGITNAPVNSYVVFFGDSWAEGWTPDGVTNETWPVEAAKYVGLPSSNYEIYKKGGAGYINTVDGINFNTLLENASTVNAERVTHVVLLGGTNDCYTNQTISDYYNACQTWIFAAKAKYPNAKIIIGYNGRTIDNNSASTHVEFARQTLFACASTGYAIMDSGSTMESLFNTNFASDMKHPTSAGQKWLGGAIGHAIVGDYSYASAYPYFDKTSNSASIVITTGISIAIGPNFTAYLSFGYANNDFVITSTGTPFNLSNKRNVPIYIPNSISGIRTTTIATMLELTTSAGAKWYNGYITIGNHGFYLSVNTDDDLSAVTSIKVLGYTGAYVFVI